MVLCFVCRIAVHYNVICRAELHNGQKKRRHHVNSVKIVSPFHGTHVMNFALVVSGYALPLVDSLLLFDRLLNSLLDNDKARSAECKHKI